MSQCGLSGPLIKRDSDWEGTEPSCRSVWGTGAAIGGFGRASRLQSRARRVTVSSQHVLDTWGRGREGGCRLQLRKCTAAWAGCRLVAVAAVLGELGLAAGFSQHCVATLSGPTAATLSGTPTEQQE